MLTDLKMFSLACETRTDQSPIELNFEDFEIQKLNIPTDRAQKVYQKNGFICLVVMFKSRVMVFKCQKWLIFCIFSDNSKKFVRVWARST